MNWEIRNYRPYERNTLKGFFDLQIGPLLIRGFTHHIMNDREWVGAPGKPQVDKDGQIQRNDQGKIEYYPVVSIDKPKLPGFQTFCLKKIAELSPQPPASGSASGGWDNDSDDEIPF
jgi:hypothetical protein